MFYYRNILRALNIFFLYCLLGGILYPQQSGIQDKENLAQKIFSEIEQGILAGNVNIFSEYFSSQTYISLSSGQNGYYSANQAFYVLQDYFNLHQAINFKFTAMNTTQNPYATGVYSFESRSKRGSAQFFISLKQINNSWQISQFTIR